MVSDKIWVLIPVYNEERTIREVVSRTKEVIPNILIVNDGSTDNTNNILNNIKDICLINIRENSGKANALKKGMDYLREKDADKVVVIDADLQHLPEEIPRLLNADADIVVGVREDRESMPLIRKIGNFLAAKIVSMQTGLDCNDPQSGFRAFSKKAVNELSFNGENFNIEKKVLLELSEKDLTYAEVPISCIYEEDARESYYDFKDLLEFFGE